MEINITNFVRNVEAHRFSASVAELGQNASKITWDNAKSEAKITKFIDEEHRDEFERWVEDFGAWDEDHIKAWSLDECNAILIQFISGDLNELESLCHSDTDEFGINWKKARRLQEQGTVSGNIFRSEDDVFFYTGN